MKKSTIVILIVVGVLVLIGLAYYFLIYRKEKSAREGSEGSNGDGVGGSTPSPANIGEQVYLKTDKSGWVGDNGIPVYNKPVADSIGSFLEGVTRGDWYVGVPIGKVKATQNGWTQVSVNNLQIWKFFVNPTTVYPPESGSAFPKSVKGYTTIKRNLTGDYWFRDVALIKY